MALINCPECKKEISDKATSCPYCGCPLKATTIEQTGKKWKGIQLAGMILVLLGGFKFYQSRFVDYSYRGTNQSISILIIGFIVILIGGIGAWWYHK